MNYLRPCVKRGQIAPDEEDLILRLHRLLGNRWSLIAGRIPGRTDNEIKNYWNTHLSKKLISQGIDPRTHKPLIDTTITNTTPVSAIDNDKNPVYHHLSNYEHLSSAYVIPPPTTPPSTTQNNPSPSYYIAPSQESYSGGGGAAAAAPAAVSPSASGGGNRTNATGVHPSFLAHQPAVMINKATDGAYLFASTSTTDFNNVNHQHYPTVSCATAAAATIHMGFTTPANNNEKIINGRLSPSVEEEEEADEDDTNYCTDDVFSSFLNSLINDDMFNNNNSHNQMQPQQPDDHGKNGTSNSLASTSALAYANLSFAAAGWDAPPIMSAPSPAFDHNNHNHNQDPKTL